jgi:hypothetical protein
MFLASMKVHPVRHSSLSHSNTEAQQKKSLEKKSADVGAG